MAVATKQATEDHVLDISISKLVLDVVSRGKHGLTTEVGNVLTDGKVEQTMQGASSLTLDLVDRDYAALNSGLFSTRIDVVIDGAPFRYTKLSLVDDYQLSLAFEHRLVAEMRQHKRFIHAIRGRRTRAEFILQMLRELRSPYRFVCPQLHRGQRVEAHPERIEEPGVEESLPPSGSPGLGPHANITVKHVKASESQRRILTIALDTAVALSAGGKAAEALVVALIQENTVSNPDPGNPGDRGVLSLIDSTAHGIKKRDGHGTINPFDISEVCAHFLTAGFFGKGGAIDLAKAHPTWSPGEVAQACQGSAYPTAYDQWRDEAKQIVKAYGGGAEVFTRGAMEPSASEPAAVVRTATYEFSRGKPGEPEDTFVAATRLAGQVEWRFFVVGQKTIYLVTDDDLIRAKPRYQITPNTVGVNKLTFDVEVGGRTIVQKGRRILKPNEASLEARLDRWAAPPGTVIQVAGYGPADGRWLVDNVERSLFDASGTVHLRAPQHPLPEPQAQQSTEAEPTSASHTDVAKLAKEHPELKPKVREVLAIILAKWPSLKIGTTTSHSRLTASGNVSLHVSGEAADLIGPNMDAEAKWIADNLTSRLTEGIHNPTLAVKNGKHVDGPSFYAAGNVWADHVNHIHIGVRE